MADFVEDMLLHFIEFMSFSGVFKIPLMLETGRSKMTEVM